MKNALVFAIRSGKEGGGLTPEYTVVLWCGPNSTVKETLHTTMIPFCHGVGP